MQISPNRPTAYPKANQPKTANRPTTKFAGNRQLKPDELDNINYLNQLQQDYLVNKKKMRWQSYDLVMELLKPAFQDKAKYEENQKKTLTILQDRDKEIAQERAKQHDQLISSINSSQPQAEAAATNNTQNQPAPAAESTSDSSATTPANPSNSGGEQPAPIETKPKFRPREERTRLNVAGDVIQQYFVGKSKKIWWDLGLSVGIGAIFAIGSPVMAVTIPTTMGVIGAYRLTQLAFKMMRDPKGTPIDNMYKKWEEKEAEAAKEAEQSNS